jgi:hypothetical protein
MGGLHFGAWHISMRAQCFLTSRRKSKDACSCPAGETRNTNRKFLKRWEKFKKARIFGAIRRATRPPALCWLTRR